MATVPDIVPLSKLKPRDVGCSIYVRVIRKWNFTGKEEDGPVLHVDMILADAQGGAIYAEIPASEVHSKSPLLQTGKVYTISRFKVKGAKLSYMPVAGNTMIELTCYTRIQLQRNPADTIPTQIYKIVPFDEVTKHATDNPNFIDVIGVLTKVSAPVPMQLPGKLTSTLTTDIIIKDLRDRDFKITLWGKHGVTFNVTELYDEAAPRAIFALFTGCVPKSFKRVEHATGNNACHWYFNPAIPEAQPFYDRYRDQAFPLQLPTPEDLSATESQQPLVKEHKTLQQLNEIDPYDFPKQGFHCTVTITSMPQDSSWWYKLNFSAKDATAEADFFSFDVISRQIIKRNCSALLRLVTPTTPAPPPLAAAISTTFKFAIGLTTESYHSQDVRIYQVNAIVHNLQQPLPIQRIPVGTVTHQHPNPPRMLATTTAATTTPPPTASPSTPKQTAGIETAAEDVSDPNKSAQHPGREDGPSDVTTTEKLRSSGAPTRKTAQKRLFHAADDDEQSDDDSSQTSSPATKKKHSQI